MAIPRIYRVTSADVGVRNGNIVCNVVSDSIIWLIHVRWRCLICAVNNKIFEMKCSDSWWMDTHICFLCLTSDSSFLWSFWGLQCIPDDSYGLSEDSDAITDDSLIVFSEDSNLGKMIPMIFLMTLMLTRWFLWPFQWLWCWLYESYSLSHDSHADWTIPIFFSMILSLPRTDTVMHLILELE